VPTIRYFASARAAAGVPQEDVPAGTLEELVAALGQRHGERLALILKSCSFLVDGVSWRGRSGPITGQSTVDILPPFAGG
jgi:molybdopterin converting factor small subunit